MFAGANLACTGGETLHNGWIVLGGSSVSGSHILWWKGSLVIGEFLTLAVSLLVLVSDSDSDSGWGSPASLSDPNSDSLSIGQSCSFISSLLGPRYGCPVNLSWCNSHHCRGKVARRLMGEFVHWQLRRDEWAQANRMDYLSHGLGIWGNDVAHGVLLLWFGRWVGIMSGSRYQWKRGKGFTEGKEVRSKK